MLYVSVCLIMSYTFLILNNIIDFCLLKLTSVYQLFIFVSTLTVSNVHICMTFFWRNYSDTTNDINVPLLNSILSLLHREHKYL